MRRLLAAPAFKPEGVPVPDFAALLSTVALYVLPFLAVLTLVVTIHELGHFLAARWLGVAVDRFSIGFGRAIARWTDKAGVEWRIGWMPIGGYVRFEGDANASSSVPDQNELNEFREEIVRRRGAQAVKEYFHFKPVWVRAVIVAAGPLANFLLAIVLFSFLAMAVGQMVTRAKVAQVAAGTPAAAAGFRAGDLVTAVDGQAVESFADVQQYVALRAGQPIRFGVRRGASDLVLTATPGSRREPEPFTHRQIAVGFLGVAGSRDPADTFNRRYGPVEAVGGAVKKVGDIVGSTVFYIGRVVTGQASPDQLGGPVRMAQVSRGLVQASAQGATSVGAMVLSVGATLLSWAAVLSVSIGFMNLLPVPVLDGGHLVFYAYEAAARRPVAARVQAAGYRVGLALLLGLMVFATWNDIQPLRLFKLFGGVTS